MSRHFRRGLDRWLPWRLCVHCRVWLNLGSLWPLLGCLHKEEG